MNILADVQWDVAGIITAILLGIGALLTGLIKHANAARIEWRKWKLEEDERRAKLEEEEFERQQAQRLQEDDELDNSYKWALRKQDKRISELEGDVKGLRMDHHQCIEKEAKAVAERDQLLKRVEQQDKEISNLRLEVQELRRRLDLR